MELRRALPLRSLRAASLFLALTLALVFAGCKPAKEQSLTLHFTMPQDGFVSVQIKAADGRKVRDLATAQAYSKGRHELVWDGRDDQQHALPAGDYVWSGVSHAGIRATLRGWACAGTAAPWNRDGWGGTGGVPNAVAADEERVFLGWNNVESGNLVVACDPDGTTKWVSRLGNEATDATTSRVQALSADAGVLYVLFTPPGDDDADEIRRLDARDGTPIPWPDHRALKISDLWAADAAVKPSQAAGMCAQAGHIYLTFADEEFLAVLDAKTGAYLQTVVGAAPELVGVVPTKSESPDDPATLMAADFAVVSLRGGVLGKVLFAHDPIWVMVSDLQPLERKERITALTVLGDDAPHLRHSLFVGLGAPLYQLQRRSVLDTEGFFWTAGHAGGRPKRGPWIREALGTIRGVELDARGKLWVAENDAVPPRFSVWDTAGTEGTVVREFFGPVDRESTACAVFPGDPNVFYAAGCEWRIDPATGVASCAGIVTRDRMSEARYAKTPVGRWQLLLLDQESRVSVFERNGEGNYEPREIGANSDEAREDVEVAFAGGKVRFTMHARASVDLSTEDGMSIGRIFTGNADTPAAKPGVDVSEIAASEVTITRADDGRIFAIAAGAGFWVSEITGLETVVRLPGGKLRLDAQK